MATARRGAGTAYRWLFWLCLGVLIAISVLPDVSFNQKISTFGIAVRKDYLLHYVGFLLLGTSCLKAWRLSLRTTLVLVLFAVFSELIQYFIEGRLVQVMDLASNLLGVGTAIAIQIGFSVKAWLADQFVRQS